MFWRPTRLVPRLLFSSPPPSRRRRPSPANYSGNFEGKIGGDGGGRFGFCAVVVRSSSRLRRRNGCGGGFAGAGFSEAGELLLLLRQLWFELSLGWIWAGFWSAHSFLFGFMIWGVFCGLSVLHFRLDLYLDSWACAVDWSRFLGSHFLESSTFLEVYLFMKFEVQYL